VIGWVEIAAIAFVAQLAVLPGEKVQFIIAGLSTRYSPWVVVGAAGTAFAGWTALEIWFERALQSALSPTLLDILTGAMFAAFAVLLYRSIPETDGPGAVAGRPTTRRQSSNRPTAASPASRRTSTRRRCSAATSRRRSAGSSPSSR